MKISHKNPKLKEIISEFEKFDWTYEMNDNMNILRKGDAHLEEITDLIEEFIEEEPENWDDLVDVIKKIFKDKRKYFTPVDFSEKLKGI